MERGNGSKVIAVIALVVAAVGLTVGFAAYTSTLNITSNANVTVTGDEWDVGFADATSSDMAPTTGNPVSISGSGSNAGTLNMLKYTLYQGTSAELTNESTSSVTYAFKIKNAGSIGAVLKSISSAGLTCAYNPNATTRTIEGDDRSTVGKQITPGTGTISASDCSRMFTATLTIGSTDYNLSNPGSSFSGTIPAGQAIDASLTIAGTGQLPTSVVDGDFIVTLGATTVNYASR